jgi:polyisoprenoid-binding protein YceI
MAPNAVAAVRHVIDTRASQFTVRAFASGLISSVAHSPKIAIRDWSGEVQTGESLEDLSLKVRLKTSSLEVLDELRDSDRRELHRVMNHEVLESSRFPEAVFQSLETHSEKLANELYRLKVQGQLTLHGVSSNHSFAAQVSLGADTARAYGEFTIRQTHYNIRIASIAGGNLKLRDELKFSFYVLARKTGHGPLPP